MSEPSHGADCTRGFSLPGSHALELAHLVRRWGVDSDLLLGSVGLSESQVGSPSSRISIPTVERLVERARALTREPGLGLYLGLRTHASAHGFLGFAAMTSSTIGEALDLATRFAPTRTTALGLRLQVEAGMASLVIEERTSFGTARDVVILALLVGLWQIGSTLTGQPLRGSAEVAFCEPAYFSRFARAAPGPVRFAQPSHRLVFDASILDQPIGMADPAALRLAREQCERQLDALDEGGQVVARTRELLHREDGKVRSVNEVAVQMHVSTRTLKRRLAAQGTAYSALLEEVRREKAMLLVQAARLSVDEVAARLGYRESTSFTRAFRRWTGRSPRAYRNAARGLGGGG